MLSVPHLLLLLRCWSWESYVELLASVVLHQVVFDVHIDSFFFLALGSVWVHCYVLTNILLPLCSLLIGLSFTSDLNLLNIETFTYTRCCLFVLLIAPKTSFVQLQVCTSSASTSELFIAVGSSMPNLCPISCQLVQRLPFTAPHLCTSLSLCCPIGVVFLLLHHYWAATKL